MSAVKTWIVLLLYIVFLGGIFSCGHGSPTIEQESITGHEPVRQLKKEDQKKEAYQILKEILLLSESTERKNNLPEIKALYRKIITLYPDLGLAQESYLRLVILAKEENTPAGDATAEKLYHEFLQKYPGSRLQPIIANELKVKSR